MALIYALPMVAYTVGVFWGGTLPAGPDAPQVNDKVAHFVVFLGLSLVAWPWLSRLRMLAGKGVWIVAAGCAAYSTMVGATLETWQALLPHRSAEWLDLLADAAGASLGAILIPLGKIWRQTTTRSSSAPG